jgi:hypothetical protein
MPPSAVTISEPTAALLRLSKTLSGRGIDVPWGADKPGMTKQLFWCLHRAYIELASQRCKQPAFASSHLNN